MASEKKNLHTIATSPTDPAVSSADGIDTFMHTPVSQAISTSSPSRIQEPYSAHQPTPAAYYDKLPSQPNQLAHMNDEHNAGPTASMSPDQFAAQKYANTSSGAPGPAPLSQQPGATPPMQPTDKTDQYDADGKREWSHGLYSCFSDCGTCFLACCCPCIVYGENVTRVEYLKANHGQSHPSGGESCGVDALLQGLLTAFCGAGWVLQIGTRGHLRDRYRIKGSVVGDVFKSWCCNPCALTQESREIALEESQMQRGSIPSGQ